MDWHSHWILPSLMENVQINGFEKHAWVGSYTPAGPKARIVTGSQDTQAQLPCWEQTAQAVLPKARGPCLEGAAPMPPTLTASHSDPVRAELHHLCLYIDSASFSLTLSAPPQRFTPGELVHFGGSNSYPSSQDRASCPYQALLGHLTEASQCKHTSSPRCASNLHRKVCKPQGSAGQRPTLPLAHEASAQAS